jgi:histidinol dehydrogenase
MMRIYQGEDAALMLNKAAGAEMAATGERSRLVAEIIEAVITDGDRALRDYARRFGDPLPHSLRMREEDIRSAVDQVDAQASQVLKRAAENIRRFAENIVKGLKPVSVDYPGYRAGVEYRPVERVGCYVPGGRFPLPSTALMTAVTARAAGVSRVVIACPNPSPEVVYAGMLAQVDALYCVGGAQAVAALAFGTESIERVDMVVGPGNAWVTEAKRQLQGTVGIDMLAGPSEVVIIADAAADPAVVAIDLLAQAEPAAGRDEAAKTYRYVPECGGDPRSAFAGGMCGGEQSTRAGTLAPGAGRSRRAAPITASLRRPVHRRAGYRPLRRLSGRPESHPADRPQRAFRRLPQPAHVPETADLDGGNRGHQ